MRLVTVLLPAVVAALTVSSGGGVRAQLTEPFVAAGVWYPDGPASGATTTAAQAVNALPADLDRWRRDLAAIKAAGFNSIRTGIDWTAVEPERGQYRLDRLGALLSAADTADVKAIVQVNADIAPGWLPQRYKDSAVVPKPGAAARMGVSDYCLDHPGARADVGAFIGAVAAAAARHRAFYAIDVWPNPAVSPRRTQFCYCPYTQARFRDALQRKYRTADALNRAWGRSFHAWTEVAAPGDTQRATTDVLDWKQFTAVKLQEDLKFRADASSPRGARAVTSHSDAAFRPAADPWLMTAVVDHYGTTIPSQTMSPDAVRLMTSLDAMRSATRDKPWWVASLQAGAPSTGEGVRLRAWAAISRGAGAITFEDWRVLTGNDAARPSLPDGLRAAVDVAGVVGRNSSLFGPLRPHASRIAIIAYADPLSRGESANAGGSAAAFYKACFDRNLQVDFMHPDEVLAGAASRYDIIYAGDVATPPAPVAELLKVFIRDGGTLIAQATAESPRVPAASSAAGGLADVFVAARSATKDRPTGELDVVEGTYGAGHTFLLRQRRVARGRTGDDGRGVDGVLQRVIAAAGAKPEIGIDAVGELVEARFLESADAMLIVGMNHGSTPRKVTFTFGPDVPEAIWQNMESGAAVNFVQGPGGPIYTRTLGGRDVMVLVRGKRLR